MGIFRKKHEKDDIKSLFRELAERLREDARQEEAEGQPVARLVDRLVRDAGDLSRANSPLSTQVFEYVVIAVNNSERDDNLDELIARVPELRQRLLAVLRESGEFDDETLKDEFDSAPEPKIPEWTPPVKVSDTTLAVATQQMAKPVIDLAHKVAAAFTPKADT